jgi:hypothetical protein
MFMPGAFALAGLVIALVRRAGEGAPRKSGKSGKSGKSDKSDKSNPA